jgi:hypothetical protein
VAIAAEKIRHRDIVNLKQSVTRHAASEKRHLAPMSRLRSEASRVHDSPPARDFREANRLIVSAQHPARTLSEAAARTRPEFTTHYT